ncbi:MAG TPA: hypothetical protein VKU00_03390, partial [Chthonomonadaceae bacterium]|nr:hypothetical protein [Chthonomonadaceae bacterium]
VATLFALALLAMRPGQDAPGGKTDTPPQGKWVAASDDVLKHLEEEGKKVSWPGQTAGVSVDRATGDVRMIVPDQGIWRSSDRGATFVRMDSGSPGGRCETGYALNADPAGKRLACFMLDGSSAITLDNGKTWNTFQQHGRGWDYGAVDWSQTSPQVLLAVHHESDGELHLSTDGGKAWKLLGKNYTAVGIFDAGALVASKGDGILRSRDGGMTWTKVSDHTPTGRVLCVFKGVGYWVTREGLLVSKDKGATWQAQGSALEAAWGPFFGRDERQIVVVGKRDKEAGFWQSGDAGQTWKLVAPWPDFGKEGNADWTPSKQWAAGWFFNFGWDPRGNLFYASRMGHPTFKYALLNGNRL